MTTKALEMGQRLPSVIKDCRFMVVGMGEGYSTHECAGHELLAIYQLEVLGDASDSSELEWALERISDPDQWSHDSDYGPTTFSLGIGETDHLSFYRLTHCSKQRKMTDSQLVDSIENQRLAVTPQCNGGWVIEGSCGGLEDSDVIELARVRGDLRYAIELASRWEVG